MAAWAFDARPFEDEVCGFTFCDRIANAACRVGGHPRSDAQTPANVTAVFEPGNPAQQVAPALFLSEDFVVASRPNLDESQQAARSARRRGECVADADRRSRLLTHQDWDQYARARAEVGVMDATRRNHA